MGQRQHTVPKSYLLGFSDPRGRLHAFDRQGQRQLPISVGDASVVTDFYQMTGGVDVAMVERRVLGDIEGEAAGVFSRIRKGESAIDEKAQSALGRFIAMQLVRTTRARQWDEDVADWYGKIWFQGMTRADVALRFRENGIEPLEEQIDAVLELVQHPDRFRFKPPQGSFLLLMLKMYLRLLPYLNEGWNWIVVHSSGRPFLTSDHPVVMVGDLVNGGVGVASAAEIWLPVGRHHAVVLSRDYSLPPVLLSIPSDHVRRLCQRIALEAQRWIYWHPKDSALKDIDVPSRGKNLVVDSVGWRDRPDGLVGEIIRFGDSRPKVTGECLLSGRLVIDQEAVFDGLRTRDELLNERGSPASKTEHGRP